MNGTNEAWFQYIFVSRLIVSPIEIFLVVGAFIRLLIHVGCLESNKL